MSLPIPPKNMAAAKKSTTQKFVSPGVTVEEKHVSESSIERDLLNVLNAGFSVHSINYYMNRTNWNNNNRNVEYALHDPSGKTNYTYLDNGTYKESLRILIEDNSKK